MTRRYFDTSAAVKYYRMEIGTPKVSAMLAEPASHSFISSIGLVEFDSVFARLVRMGQITAAEFQMARGRVSADVQAGIWQTILITDAHCREAQRIITRLGPTNKARTLDAIHVAFALVLYGVGVSPDGAIVAAGGEEGIVRLYNGANGSLLKELLPPGVTKPGARK